MSIQYSFSKNKRIKHSKNHELEKLLISKHFDNEVVQFLCNVNKNEIDADIIYNICMSGNIYRTSKLFCIFSKIKPELLKILKVSWENELFEYVQSKFKKNMFYKINTIKNLHKSTFLCKDVWSNIISFLPHDELLYLDSLCRRVELDKVFETMNVGDSFSMSNINKSIKQMVSVLGIRTGGGARQAISIIFSQYFLVSRERINIAKVKNENTILFFSDTYASQDIIGFEQMYLLLKYIGINTSRFIPIKMNNRYHHNFSDIYNVIGSSDIHRDYIVGIYLHY